MQKTEFEFTLTTPFTFANGGEKAEAEKLILSAPNNRNAHRVRLQQAFVRTIKSMASDIKEEDKEKARLQAKEKQESDDSEASLEDNGNQIYQVLLSSDLDMSLYHGYFRDMICDTNAPCCSIEGLQKMTFATYDKMSPDDTDRLLGQYMANFIIASVTGSPKKK